MSKVQDALEYIAAKIRQHPSFKQITIYWDDIELSPNSTSFPCIVFHADAWSRENDHGCDVSKRTLEIILADNNLNKREAIKDLWDYNEALLEVMDSIESSTDELGFDLKLMGGSELAVLRYVNKDKDSHKAAKTTFASLVSVYYELRY